MRKLLLVLIPFLFMGCATISSLGNVEENHWVSNTEYWQATPSEAKYIPDCVDILMDYDAVKIGYENSYDIILKKSSRGESAGTYIHNYQTRETTPFSVYSNGHYTNGSITTTYNHRDTYLAVNQYIANNYIFLKGFNWNIPEDTRIIYVTSENVKRYFNLAKVAYNYYYDVGYHNGWYYVGQYILGGWIYKLANKPTLPKGILKENENGN